MIRRTPFEEMNRMFERMSRSMWDDVGSTDYRDTGARLERTDDGYVVLADLPGFEREEIDLQFDDGFLTIRADHDAADDHRTLSRHVHEELRVPDSVDVDAIEASYRNGVLEIRLPVDLDEDDSRRIEIE